MCLHIFVDPDCGTHKGDGACVLNIHTFLSIRIVEPTKETAHVLTHFCRSELWSPQEETAYVMLILIVLNAFLPFLFVSLRFANKGG